MPGQSTLRQEHPNSSHVSPCYAKKTYGPGPSGSRFKSSSKILWKFCDIKFFPISSSMKILYKPSEPSSSISSLAYIRRGMPPKQKRKPEQNHIREDHLEKNYAWIEWRKPLP